MRYLAGVIAAAVLVLPASAAGATLGPDRPLIAGPAVAGDAVLVVTAAGRRGYEVLRLGAGPPEVITGRRLADVFGQRTDLRSARLPRRARAATGRARRGARRRRPGGRREPVR